MGEFYIRTFFPWIFYLTDNFLREFLVQSFQLVASLAPICPSSTLDTFLRFRLPFRNNCYVFTLTFLPTL